MAQINVGLEFGREFEGELKTALTFTDKKEQSLAIIIVARLFRSQSRKASVVL